MRRSLRDRGEGRLGLLFAVIIVAYAIYVSVQFVPVYVGTYDLEETIREEVERASIKTNEQIISAVMAKAKERELPLKREQITLRRTHSKFKMSVEFATPVDFALFQFDYPFKQEEEAPLW